MATVSILVLVDNSILKIISFVKNLLNQTFIDFDLNLILTNVSINEQQSFLKSVNDSRIQLLNPCNTMNKSEQLNWGTELSKGKYIGLIDSNYYIHSDWLKIEVTLMEKEPQIISSTFYKSQLENRHAENDPIFGILEKPLLAFMQKNKMLSKIALIRKDFLIQNNLTFENYPNFEEFKLNLDICKCGGSIYLESQALPNYRLPIGKEKDVFIQDTTHSEIINNIITFIIENNKEMFPELDSIFKSFKSLKEKNIMVEKDINHFFYSIFNSNNLSFKVINNL